MALDSIEKEWTRFASLVFERTPAGPTQRAEMKKAFFAGYWALMQGVNEMGEPHVSEAEAEAWLSARREECHAFSTRLLREYAEGN